MSTTRITNKDASSYVSRRALFKGSNLYSENRGNAYVVFSYGEHFPLFIYAGGKWYENEVRYSPSTSRHQTQARPDAAGITMLDTSGMKELLNRAVSPASAA